MWLKLLILSSFVLAILASSPTRKWSNSLGSGYLDAEPEFSKKSEISLLVDPDDGISYRLPNNTVPVHYEINLATDIHLGVFEFSGDVNIRVRGLESTTKVFLHSRNLNINNLRLTRDTGATIASSYVHHEDTEILEITTNLPIITEGFFFRIIVEYTGTLRDDRAGFYRSSYEDDEGNIHFLAVTQFESTDARHAFPCFDEPGIRSTFTISIRHHNSYSAISNMPVDESNTYEEEDYVVTYFQETPEMPTYLVAFLVSDYISTDEDEDTEFLIPHKIYAKPQSIQKGEGKLAHDLSGRILYELEKYFGMSYTLPKMDQAAIPDFAGGAMENWGLVTYRDPFLLYNDEIDLTSDQDFISRIIAHEFTHQFLGNLATISWWGHLWLKEGFAQYYECFILDQIEPEGGWIQSFYANAFHYVLQVDAEVNIRPMTQYVESPENIRKLFDDIGYDKAASVIRMFQNALSDTTWSKGLNHYLTTMQFKSASPEDLYAGIQEAVDEDWGTGTLNVAELMGSWEHQSGFPYVTVSRSENSLNFEQNRFMYADRNSENLWWIPVSYRIVGRAETDSSTSADFWIPNQQTFTLNGATAPRTFTSSDLVLINYQQSGYYRVNYDTELWEEFIEMINNEETLSNIHLMNRAQLIDDSFHLARANLIDYDILLGLMDYLEMETDYLPWVATNRANTILARQLSGTEVYTRYQEFMKKNVKTIYDKFGVDIIENEARLERYIRNIATNIACWMGDEDCLTASLAHLDQSLSTGNAVHPDIAVSIYCNGMRSATKEIIDATILRATETSNVKVRNAIFSGVGCINEPELLKEFLDTIATSSLSSEEKQRTFISALNNGASSVGAVIEYIDENHSKISELLVSICNSISIRVATEEIKNEFVLLVDKLDGEGLLAESDVSDMKTRSDEIIEWQKDHIEEFEEFFNRVPDVPTDEPGTETTTEGPTNAPTSAPPTNAPPTEGPTEGPTDAPTNAPGTEPPTNAPGTEPPTNAPTAAPGETPSSTTQGSSTVIFSLNTFIVFIMAKLLI